MFKRVGDVSSFETGFIFADNMNLTYNGHDLKVLGRGGYKKVFLSYCETMVHKALWDRIHFEDPKKREYLIRKDVAALWKALSEGLPVAEVLGVDYNVGMLSQRLLKPLEGIDEKYFAQWNDKWKGKTTHCFDIKAANVGFCPVQERLVIHDCCWVGSTFDMDVPTWWYCTERNGWVLSS